MNIDRFIFKVKQKIKNLLGYIVFQYPRVLKYKILSNCKNVIGSPIYNQPTQLLGEGTILFDKNVNLGVKRSPFFYNGYGYIDARKSNSKIIIKNHVTINNNFMITSEGEGIEIGENTLIGLNFEVSDSDFHDLHPDRRISGIPKTAKVVIGRNVFIGSNVKILKGVTIGDNSVIANSSVVIKSIPKNVIAGGCPAKIIRKLEV
ncbi:acyltransferase [Arcobacter ellisii]|uniref:Acetyltransferase n=1 Tax=Arcobacter ellisii TaxID=913109 RepID=A0A347UAL6_9BACT|nr:acyltransferase [Arcobacter ellisii]AXX95894.1 sugar O-acyltransferase [Arcobacter ellisii]RXI29752.1 acetyltransferase [Arcobacter ellisii]